MLLCSMHTSSENSGRTLRRKKCGCTMGFFLIASSLWILDLWEVCNSWDAHSRATLDAVGSFLLRDCCWNVVHNVWAPSNRLSSFLQGNDKLLWKNQKFDTIPDWCIVRSPDSSLWGGVACQLGGSLLLIMQVLWSQKTWSFVYGKVLD